MKNTDPHSVIDFIKKLKEDNIPEHEYRRRINSFIEFKARDNYIPLHGNFELTPLCNLNCKMCYVHLDNSQFNSDKLLKVGQWKNLMQQAYEHGMRTACLTGGECLTYHGFKELCVFLQSLKVQVSVLSNGVLLDQEYVDFFTEHRPKQIQISVYGSNDDEYEAVTGHRVCDLVYNNISLIRDANLPVRIAITPNRYMDNDFRVLLNRISDLKVPYVINSSLFQARESTGRSVSDPDIADYIKLYQIDSELYQRELTPIDISELPDPMNEEGVAESGLRCGGGRSSFAIMHNGSMCACLSLSEYSVSALDNGFKSAWEAINTYSANYPFPQECNGCVYYNDCYHCVAHHKQAPLGHCDKRVCEKNIALIRTGLKTLHKRP